MYNVAVARLITRKEIQSNPADMKALTSETDKLKSRNTWDISSVREWPDVSKEATWGKSEGPRGTNVPDRRREELRVTQWSPITKGLMAESYSEATK